MISTGDVSRLMVPLLGLSFLQLRMVAANRSEPDT
jgi:hypothetical protein